MGINDFHSNCIMAIAIVLLGTTAFYAFSSVSDYYSYQENRARLEIQHRQNLELTERVDHVKQEVKSLRHSKRAVEKKLRNRSLVVGEDEQVVYFKDKGEIQ